VIKNQEARIKEMRRWMVELMKKRRQVEEEKSKEIRGNCSGKALPLIFN